MLFSLELGLFSNFPSEPTFALVFKVPHRQVWGLAYEISDEDWEGGVRDQLDHREKGGYSQHRARSISLFLMYDWRICGFYHENHNPKKHKNFTP